MTTFGRFVRPLTSRFFSEYSRKVLPRWLPGRSSGRLPDLLGRALGIVLLREGPAADLMVEPVSHFGSEWDDWHGANAPTSGVFCSRDSAYMNHRYGEGVSEALRVYAIRAREAGHLEGMFALRVSEDLRTCFLIDFMTRFDVDAMRMGLSLASSTARALGSDALKVRSTPHALFTRALAAERFFERDRTERLEFPLLIPESARPEGRPFEGEAWYFLDGDLDGEAA